MYQNGTTWCTEVVLAKSTCTEVDHHCTEVDMYRYGPPLCTEMDMYWYGPTPKILINFKLCLRTRLSVVANKLWPLFCYTLYQHVWVLSSVEAGERRQSCLICWIKRLASSTLAGKEKQIVCDLIVDADYISLSGFSLCLYCLKVVLTSSLLPPKSTVKVLLDVLNIALVFTFCFPVQ